MGTKLFDRFLQLKHKAKVRQFRSFENLMRVPIRSNVCLLFS